MSALQRRGLTAEVIAVKTFEELKSLPREKVVGKIVLFDCHFDKEMAAEGHGGEAYGEAVVYRGSGPSAAAKKGAVACLVRSVGGADYRLPHTGATNYSGDALKIPAAAVTAEDAERRGRAGEDLQCVGVDAADGLFDAHYVLGRGQLD